MGIKNFLLRLWWKVRPPGELREEIEAHICMRAQLNRSQGMSEQDARLEARRPFVNTLQIEEATRAVYVGRLLETTLQDLRYAIRTLSKKPAFTLVAVLTLALAIGANTAIFQMLDRIVLKPLPVREPHKLVQLQGYH